MPVNSRTGSWIAAVNCGPGGAATKRFVVGPEPAHAQVSVLADGFTQSNYSGTSQTFISYGVEFENSTVGVAALNVKASVSFTDTLGRSVATDVTTITAIPGSTSFYLGGLALSNVSLTVAGMQVAITVGSGVREKLTLPIVSDVAMSTGSFGDSVSGAITNPYSAAMSSDANIYVVYFGTQGNIVGGESEQAGASIEPHSTADFGFSEDASDINPDFIPAGDVASIQASVDPCSSLLVSVGGACPMLANGAS